MGLHLKIEDVIIMAITDYPITSDWNEIDNMHPINGHTGIDYAIPQNTPLEAISDGIITVVSTNEMLGNNIRYKTPNGEVIVYGHLSSFKSKVGDVIHKGDIIGYSGGDPKIQPSGRSNGSHLHLSVYNNNGVLVNPEPYILGQVQNNSSPFLFPIILIILLFILWKFKRVFAYSVAIILGLFIIFIVS